MSMWYVVQVLHGHEDVMAGLISSMMPAEQGVLQEIFSPSYETERKARGRWYRCTRTLLPGYLIAVTEYPDELDRQLHELPEFARVLRRGEVCVPLSDAEVEVIGRDTVPGNRIVPMSAGVKDGETVVVTQGPLKGHEGLITRIDRRHSVAYVTFQMCGQSVNTRLGLAVMTSDKRIREDMRTRV